MTNEEHITRISMDAAKTRKSETDWNRVRHSDDAARDSDDIDIDWATARLVEPSPKKMISLRVDRDVLEFFQSAGRGYQTRMNAVLRAYKDAQERS